MTELEMMIKRERQRTVKSLQDLLDKATEAFGYDREKALNWYMNKRPEFGNKTPFEMCKQGFTAKIIKALERSLI